MRTLRALGVLLGIAAAAACGKKSSTPAAELTGLAAVPASAEVVVVVDVPRVAHAPLVERAVQQLLASDANLATPWQKLHDSCKIDFANQVKHVVLALGPKAPQTSSRPVLMVATGKLAEQELAGCVRAMVGQGGGELTAKPLGSRTLYQAKDGNRVVYFAFTRADTVVLGSTEAYVTEALGGGKLVLDNAEMKGLVALADQNLPVWGAGKTDERVRQGLLRPTGGKLSSGPVALVFGADLADGLKAELDAVMANPADAKTLESFLKENLVGLGMAAQIFGLQKAVERLTANADGSIVRVKAAVTVDEINQMISSLDAKGSAAQDSPPAVEPGSAAPAGK